MKTHSVPLTLAVHGPRARNTTSVIETAKVKSVVRWTFCLYVFSLPFDLPQAGLPLEVTTLTASIFLLAALRQPRVCFQRPPAAWWCFSGFIYVYLISMFWNGSGYNRAQLQADQAKLIFLLLQIMFLCWASYNVLREERNALAALLTFASSCTILAVVHIFGFARTSTEVASNIERLSTFGQNPNTLARHLCIAVLILIGLSYGRRKPAFAYSIVVWPLVALILYALQTTGARGGLIALGSGLLFFSLGGEGVATRVRNIGVVLLAITFCIWMALQSETMAQRFEKSFDEGSMAQRENLYPAAWKMVVDRPLLGWGPTLNMWELGSRVGEPDHPFRDTHDLLLEILTVSGVFGAIPFFAGVFLCLHSSWRGQKGAEGVLPLATTVAILVSNVGANLLYNKVYWLLIAYALASKDQWSDKNQPERSFPAALIRDRQLKNVLT